MGTKVLVIDDSMMVRQQVKRALSSIEGFEIIEAQDGVDALEKANATPDIGLVICDVNMPRMDGLDFLSAFRSDKRFLVVPVVMLTTEAHSDLVARSKALGAKGWIIKPFKPDLLAAAARRLVALSAAA
jgi:two-component system chemotaxis response regulator CheY